MTIQNQLLSQAFVTRACHWLFSAWYVKSHEIFGSSRSCVRNIIIIVDHDLYLPTEIPVWIIHLPSGGKRHSATMTGWPIRTGAWKMRSFDVWQFRLLSLFEDKCMHFSSNEVFTTRWKILSLICVDVPDVVPGLARHFFVILLSGVFQPSCCVRSLFAAQDRGYLIPTVICYR